MRIQFAVAAATIGLLACTSSSPLEQISPQVEVNVDPEEHIRSELQLSIKTWENLEVLADAVASGQIVVTLDDEPLVVDPVGTTYLGGGYSYIATFALPHRGSADAKTSVLAISDGVITWSVELQNLFATDLAPTAPLAAGENTLIWPSAIPRGALSTIYWSCVELVGVSSDCGGTQLPESSVRISQQYISATIAGVAGDRVVVTAERHAAPTSSGPIFVAKIRNRYEATLAR